MENPFKVLDARLSSIEDLVLNLKPNEGTPLLSKYTPIKKFCDEMGMTRANLYNLNRKGIIRLKKLGGKTFVDVEEVEAAMRNFIS